MNKKVGLRRTHTVHYDLANSAVLTGEEGNRTSNGKKVHGMSRNGSTLFGPIENSLANGRQEHTWPSTKRKKEDRNNAEVIFKSGIPTGTAKLTSIRKTRKGVWVEFRVTGKIEHLTLKNIKCVMRVFKNRKKRPAKIMQNLPDQNVYTFKANWNKWVDDIIG